MDWRAGVRMAAIGTRRVTDEARAQSGTMTELERRLRGYVGAPYCVTVGSAAAGLLLALRAAGVRGGAGVLTPGLSDFATAEIIRRAGGQPVFVDVNPNTYCVDPYCLEYAIARCARRKIPAPKALIAADLFGSPANYSLLEDVCAKHGVLLIEDMAQSFGAILDGRRAGSFGRMAVASFFPRPAGELGEGGAVFCHREEDAERLRALRQALDPKESLLGEVQRNVAAEKLRSSELELSRRRAVAQRYRERLSGAVKLQQITEGSVSACTHFAISLPSARLRESMIERLQLCHIPCGVFEPPPVRREASSPDRVALVNAQSVAQRILLIPMHPYLSRRVVDYICDRILDEVASPGKALADLVGAERRA